MPSYLPVLIAFVLTNLQKFAKFVELCIASFPDETQKFSKRFQEFSNYSHSQKICISCQNVSHEIYNVCLTSAYTVIALVK